MAQSTIINTAGSYSSNYQGDDQGPKLVANQYVQGASLTLEPGNYVLYANCTFESDSGSGNRTIALRIGPSSTVGDFIYKVEPNAWNKEILVSLVHIQTTTTYSNYLYSSVASTKRCTNELKAIKL